jgi:hypothetical protein
MGEDLTGNLQLGAACPIYLTLLRQFGSWPRDVVKGLIPQRFSSRVLFPD